MLNVNKCMKKYGVDRKFGEGWLREGFIEKVVLSRFVYFIKY